MGVACQELVYTDQSADELQLTLFDGTIDKRDLSVLSSINLPSPLGRVELAIIGASHYFQVFNENDDSAIGELFACLSAKHHTAASYTLGMLNKPINKLLNGFAYRFSCEKHNWKSGKAQYDELIKRTNEIDNTKTFGMRLRFPGNESANFEPLTLVYLDASTSHSLKLSTLHAYPNEDCLVFTNTTVSQQLEGCLEDNV